VNSKPSFLVVGCHLSGLPLAFFEAEAEPEMGKADDFQSIVKRVPWAKMGKISRKGGFP